MLKNKTKRPFEEKLPLILAFAIPVLVMIGVCAGKGIWPFGDNCFLRTDLYHQYAPFFSDLGERLKNGGSLLYAWDIGLGSNYPALFAYYLCSPFQLLLFVVADSYIIEFITLSIIIKIGLAGLGMAIYLCSKFKTRSLGTAIFAICYALSGYMAAYSWDIMWLDCIWLAPIIMLGLEKLVNEKKPFLYCITLALAIFTNYYIAIMLCIFMVIYFICLILMKPEQKITEYLKKFGLFILYSGIAGALAAVVLLPAIYVLPLTASAKTSFPTTVTSYFSIIDELSRHLTLVECEEGLEHWPNIYCGVLTILCLPMYYMDRKVGAREKVVKTLILAIMLASFALNVPNYIWHGLHYPNSLPCRQSFLYTIVILTMCFEGFKDIKWLSKGKLVGCIWGSIAFTLLCEKLIDAEEFHWYSFAASVAFIAFFGLVFYLYREGRLEKAVAYVVTFAVLVVELGLNTAVTSVPTTNRSSYWDDKSDYQALHALTDQDGDLFYRSEKATLRTKNDGVWNGYESASLFSSTTYAGVSSFYKKVGCEGNTNAYSFNGATPLIASMLSVKYIYSTTTLPESGLYELISTSGDLMLYKNNYTLPLGYVLPSDINDLWNYTSMEPAKAQNALVNLLDESAGDILHAIPGSTTGNEYTTTTTERAQVYIYIENQDVDDVTVTYGENSKGFTDVKRHYLLSLGYVEAGTDITVTADDTDEILTATAYTFDDDTFVQLYEKLATEGLELSDMTESYFKTSLSGTVSSDGGSLVTSIPYDEGWQVYVDGVRTQYDKFSDAFIMIPLTAGEHTITMEFVPQGLITGAGISLAALVVLGGSLLISVLLRRHRRKKEEKAAANAPKLEEQFDVPRFDPVDEETLAGDEEELVLTIDSVLEKNEEKAQRTAAAEETSTEYEQTAGLDFELWEEFAPERKATTDEAVLELNEEIQVEAQRPRPIDSREAALDAILTELEDDNR